MHRTLPPPTASMVGMCATTRCGWWYWCWCWWGLHWCNASGDDGDDDNDRCLEIRLSWSSRKEEKAVEDMTTSCCCFPCCCCCPCCWCCCCCCCPCCCCPCVSEFSMWRNNCGHLFDQINWHVWVSMRGMECVQVSEGVRINIHTPNTWCTRLHLQWRQ